MVNLTAPSVAKIIRCQKYDC